MKRVIYQYLLMMGLSPKYIGFRYSLEAILLYFENKNMVKLADDVYSKIAKKYRVSCSCVIKGIKNALDSALLRQGKHHEILDLLQNEKSGSIRVSEFIAYASNFIRYRL